ncbi:hypothetical protein Cgig2_023361 [Carnegiea gigantea]|uniref:Uncharacterized protein n=1 Tax=Carnegiea gigantea TaxID=171969 RepID=A0A9Q1JL38_9CARY|nr:hypothetical protein Cgig2_023361 [Carnegiea gigantea]
MLGQTSSTLRLFHRKFRPTTMKFRSLITPKFVVSSSLGPLLASAAAAAAAAAAGSSTHGAVTSTITQVAVTAVAIASGACLSTKVDFLWPKPEEPPSPLIFDGVDVTGYSIFNDPKVQNAISFARKAHHGQLRRTGDPYLTHCLHTGRILAMLVPASGQRICVPVEGFGAFRSRSWVGRKFLSLSASSVAVFRSPVNFSDVVVSPEFPQTDFSGAKSAVLSFGGAVISGQPRAVDTVVAGILHDVIDDAGESLRSIRESFGNDVSQMVAGVSRLSYINQLLRRHRRINANQNPLSHNEANNLRVMLLGMVDDPRVVLIKLADRLHNMRTM